MNIRWLLASTLSLFLAAPGTALAQADGEKPAEKSKTEEPSEDADAAKKKAEAAKKKAEEAEEKAEEAEEEAEDKAEEAEEKMEAAEEEVEEVIDAGEKAGEKVEDNADAAKKVGADMGEEAAEAVNASEDAVKAQAEADKAAAAAKAAADKAAADKAAADKAAADKAAADKAAAMKKEQTALEQTMDDGAAGANAASTTATDVAAGTAAGAEASKAAKKEKGNKDKANQAAALGAGMAIDDSKPWLVSATFEQTLGQSVFVKDQQLRRGAYGYAVFVSGSYDLFKVGSGVVRATARIAADQQLTNTAFSAGTGPRQFFFRDIIVGLSGVRLYKEPNTGIIFNGRFSLTLPTSLQAQAAERWLTVGAGGSVMKTFAKLGPGNLTLIGSLTGQKTVAPAQPTSDLAFCDSISAADNGVCFSSLTNPSVNLFYGLTAVYGIGSFNISAGVTVINSFRHDQNESVAPTGPAANPSSSPFAKDDPINLATTTWATVQASYVLTSHWSVGAGWSTIQSPIFQAGSNPKAIKFPFWNFQDPSYNASVFFLDLNYLY